MCFFSFLYVLSVSTGGLGVCETSWPPSVLYGVQAVVINIISSAEEFCLFLKQCDAFQSSSSPFSVFHNLGSLLL